MSTKSYGLVEYLTTKWRTRVGLMPSIKRSRRQNQSGRSIAEVELLEQRSMLSAATVLSHLTAIQTIEVEKLAAPSSASGYTPSQLQAAYGFNQVSFAGASNGAGQTIAIVDAYHDPNILSDLRAFDAAFGLADPPSFKVVSQTGSTTNLPGTDPSATAQSSWEIEEALDVEWAHALAPGASIILVEANSASYADLMAGVKMAASLPGVSVVSMSWGGNEFSSETSYDSYFTTPTGHQGVTFVASTGDAGAPGGFPAYSKNVLAVGGTTLTLNSSGGYISESAWSGSGGGVSQFESQPSYQKGIVTQTTTKRSIPDVAFDANPNTGVPVYSTFKIGTGSPWSQVGGTSLSAPAWASVVAVIDQGRSQNGLSSLDGATQTIPMLYQLSQSNLSAFHDITSGNNGFAAAKGYDLVTGLGSPVVNLLVAGMTGTTQSSTPKLVFQQEPQTGTAGQALGTITVAIQDQYGRIISNDNSKVTLSISSGSSGFTSTSTVSVNAVNGLATFTNLILNISGSYTINATDSGHTSTVSPSLMISSAQPAKLAFQLVPTSGSVGTSLPSVVVAVEDQFGNIVTSDHSTVTISIVSGPAGFGAGSVTSATAVNGIATFKSLILTAAGTYSIRAIDGGLTAASSTTFSVGSVLAAPQNVSAVALSSTSARLSWSAVPGTQGYRVFQVIGSQMYLLGTVNSATTAVQISSLAPGSTDSFVVQSYNGSSSANSAPVSVKLSANASTGLTVSATTLSSSRISLAWNSISGASGYRIYYSIGTTRTLLSVVSAGTISTRISGLVAGVNYQFQIEAFGTGSVLDSNVITVNTSAAVSNATSMGFTSFGDEHRIGLIRMKTRR